MLRHKISYGIALCRFNDKNQPEIILIKKRYSYYFYEFVLGKYQKNNEEKSNKYLMKMFNNMTYHEKLEILSFKFENLWYKIWLEPVNIKYNKEQKDSFYMRKNKGFFSYKHKFESIFLVDSGKRLKSLINNSTNSDTTWEIPKGRKSANEKEIDTAKREFIEETNIKSDDFRILLHVPPIVDTYRDAGTTYKNIYYLATLIPDKNILNPKIYFNSYDQTLEVESVKWVSLSEIKFLSLNQKTKKRTIRLFENILKIFKKECKLY